MRESAHRAVGVRCAGEVEIGEGVRFARAGGNAEILEQMFADQMRRLPGRRADAQVERRLAVEHRQQLRVAVGEVQQAHVAERRDAVVERRAGGQVERPRIAHRQSGGGGRGDGMEEFAAVHGGKLLVDPGRRGRPEFHLLTGESGSISSATRSLICCSERIWLWPKRGMFEQAL